jgi:hypothetical protein
LRNVPPNIPAKEHAKERVRPDKDYVDGQAGWRVVFFAAAIACIAGLGFRLYFSPERIRHWVDDAIARQSLKVSMKFDSAELSLTRGSLPQLAVVLSHVEVAPAPLCHPEPSVKIGSLRIPVRISSLLSARIAVGIVSAADIFVDLDGLKVRCPSTAQQNRLAPKRVPADASPGVNPGEKTDEKSSHEIATTPSFVQAPAKPWWMPEQLKAVQNLVSGFEFSQVEVEFENKTKKVYLESFLAKSDPGEKVIHVKTAVRIPEDMTYGEKIPPLKISGDVEADAADIIVRAVLSEGSLESHARLSPAPEGQIAIDAHAAVKNVPLSTTIPILARAGIIKNTFKPRFLWLACEISVKGQFQGLLKKNPLKLDQCEVQGEGARVYLASAVRGPDGSWDPFTVELSNVNVARMIETFGASGPDGIVAEYGRLNGRIDVRAQDDAEFTGAITDMDLLFSNRNIRTLQKITTLATKIKLHGSHIIGAIDEVGLAGGEFKGGINFDITHSPVHGEIKARIESLRLSDAVQKLMFAGSVADISGEGAASIHDGSLQDVHGRLSLSDLESSGFKIHEISLQMGIALMSPTARTPSGLNVSLRSPKIEVSGTSPLGAAIAPLFARHDSGDSDWLGVNEVQIHGVIPEDGGLRWEKARANLENGHTRLVSTGEFDRNGDLIAWIATEGSTGNSKARRWAVSGSLMKPILNEDNATPHAGDSVGTEAMSMAKKTSREIRDLSEKVIRKARGFIPAGDAPTAPQKMPN